MNCPRCNTAVTAQDKYCPGCGLPLEAARKEPRKSTGKKNYEEISTQLVDVDEFKQYLKKDNEAPTSPAPMAAAANLAGGGTLAGAGRRVDEPAAPAAPVAPVAPSHAPAAAPRDEAPAAASAGGPSMGMIAGIAVVVAAVLFAVFKLL